MFITEAGKMSLKGHPKSIEIWGGYLIKYELQIFYDSQFFLYANEQDGWKIQNLLSRWQQYARMRII